MNIAIYIEGEDPGQMEELTFKCCAQLSCHPAIDMFKSGLGIAEDVSKSAYDIVIVVADRASGMETVREIRRMDDEIGIIWFSNDESFAACAFENRVGYFALVPISQEKLMEGLLSCRPDINWDCCNVHIKAK